MPAPANPELLESVVDRSSLSDEEKALIKSALWTDGEIPAITSAEQHKADVWVERELSRGLFDPSSPEHSKTFAEWSRSPEGIFGRRIRAKVMEWEERKVGADEQTDEGNRPDQLTAENEP